MSPKKSSFFSASSSSVRTDQRKKEDEDKNINNRKNSENGKSSKNKSGKLNHSIKKSLDFIKNKAESETEDSLVDKSKNETQVQKQFFKLSVLLTGSLLILFFLAFIVAFLYSVRGAEKTVVPDLKGITLIDGVLSLQDKGLNYTIQVKYSDDPQDKGLIMEQKPPAGSYVRAGRTVSLVVSKGAVIDKIGDYVGQDINDVTLELETLFVTYKPLIKVKKPYIYRYDESPAGTILEQDPAPGTTISGLTELQFIVSRGAEDVPFDVPNYVGLPYDEAIKKLAYGNVPFLFKINEDQPADTVSVLSQIPAAGDSVMPGTTVELTLSKPKKIAKNYVFGLFEYDLPEYDVYIDLKVEKILPNQTDSLYFAMKHPGGKISFPFLDEVGTIFIIYVYDKEIYRYQLTPGE